MDALDVGTHARFSEVLFSSLFSSLYDLAIAKTLWNLGEYSWTIISSYYSAEHSINTLFIMVAGPDLFRPSVGFVNIWENNKSPLSLLKSHTSKIIFLKNRLDEFIAFQNKKSKYPPECLEKVQEIKNEIDKRLEESSKIGEILDELYKLRLHLNYEGIMISHQRRRDIEISNAIKNAAELSVNAAHVVSSVILNRFVGWFEEVLSVVDSAIAKGYIYHLNAEYMEFKHLIRKTLRYHTLNVELNLEPSISSPLSLIGKKLNHWRKQYGVKKSSSPSGDLEPFMRQTYAFRVKESLYADFEDAKNKLESILKEFKIGVT